MQPIQIVRRHGLCAMTNLSMATIYRLIKKGDFPRPLQLSAQAVGWDIHDITTWVDGRKASQFRGDAR